MFLRSDRILAFRITAESHFQNSPWMARSPLVRRIKVDRKQILYSDFHFLCCTVRKWHWFLVALSLQSTMNQDSFSSLPSTYPHHPICASCDDDAACVPVHHFSKAAANDVAGGAAGSADACKKLAIDCPQVQAGPRTGENVTLQHSKRQCLPVLHSSYS